MYRVASLPSVFVGEGVCPRLAAREMPFDPLEHGEDRVRGRETALCGGLDDGRGRYAEGGGHTF